MSQRETIRRRAYHHQHHIEHREENNQRSLDWYYENRQRVLAKHKERMRDDAEYRERKSEIQRKTDAVRYKKQKAAKKKAARKKVEKSRRILDEPHHVPSWR